MNKKKLTYIERQAHDRTRRTNETLTDYSDRLSKKSTGLRFKPRVALQWGATPEFDYLRTKWLKNRPKAGSDFLLEVEQFGIDLTNKDDASLQYIGREFVQWAREAYEILQTDGNVHDLAFCYSRIYETLLQPLEEAPKHRRKKAGETTAKLKKAKAEKEHQVYIDMANEYLANGKQPHNLTSLISKKTGRDKKTIRAALQKAKIVRKRGTS